MSSDSRLPDGPRRLFRESRLFDGRLQSSTDHDDLSASIASSIAMIEKASSVVDSMQETVRMHEETIYEQNSEIARLNNQKEDAFSKMLQLEEICRREVENAAKAEAHSATLSHRLKTLEKRNADLASQLDRMIQAVSKSFANRADTEVFRQPPLRAVS